MNIIVFGSCGFIGNSLINHYKKDPKIHLLGVDILDKTESGYFCYSKGGVGLELILTEWVPDLIINAAGAANVGLSFTAPEKDFQSNVLMVLELLNYIRQYCPTCKFLQLSSAAIYGNPSKLPVSEDDVVKPLSPYGFHKWQSEILCKEFVEIYALNISIIRIFSAYGVGLKKQIFWDLYKRALRSDDITLFGTGDESRDFIYIEDLVQAINCIVERSLFDGNVYNVANGEEIFIKDAVAYFFEKINWEGKLKFSGSNRPGDPLNWKANISRLKNLGYKQKIKLTDGIDQYCKWLKELELV
ncbi:MAG: SDR family oxidoreductase [Flavisolibacter sp.]